LQPDKCLAVGLEDGVVKGVRNESQPELDAEELLTTETLAYGILPEIDLACTRGVKDFTTHVRYSSDMPKTRNIACGERGQNVCIF